MLDYYFFTTNKQILEERYLIKGLEPKRILSMFSSYAA